MNTILLVITGASLTIAAFMSAIVWQLTREERRRSDVRVATLADALYDDDADKSEVVARLLETPHPSGWARRIFATGIAVAAVVLAASLMAIPARIAGSAPRAASPPPAPIERPLELVALEHERDGERLVVRGLGRNPAGASERLGLTAVVALVGHNGDVISSARAAIPTVKLAPGETTPFVVTATDAADVDRFRISFRTDGRVEPHVDRRPS